MQQASLPPNVGLRLLTVAASPVVKHRLYECWFQYLWPMGSVAAAPGLGSIGSVVVVHRFSCFTACGICLDQGSNPCLLHWKEDSLPLSHQGSPDNCFKFWKVSLPLPRQIIRAVVILPLIHLLPFCVCEGKARCQDMISETQRKGV